MSTSNICYKRGYCRSHFDISGEQPFRSEHCTLQVFFLFSCSGAPPILCRLCPRLLSSCKHIFGFVSPPRAATIGWACLLDQGEIWSSGLERGVQLRRLRPRHCLQAPGQIRGRSIRRFVHGKSFQVTGGQLGVRDGEHNVRRLGYR